MRRLLILIIALINSIGRLIATLFISLFFIILIFLPVLYILFPILIPLFIIYIIANTGGVILLEQIKILEKTLPEYLLEKALFYEGQGEMKYSSYSQYKRAYIDEENKRKEEERRKKREKERRQWEEFFNSAFFNHEGFNYEYRDGRFYGNTGSYENASGYSNMANSFVDQYQSAMDTLGLDYNADEAEIRRAYRKLAMKYHPDVNKAPDATEKFQEINDANSFLTKERIERYKKLVN